MKRNRTASVRLDPETHDALMAFANSQFEGNASQALRQCIRTVAGRKNGAELELNCETPNCVTSSPAVQLGDGTPTAAD